MLLWLQEQDLKQEECPELSGIFVHFLLAAMHLLCERCTEYHNTYLTNNKPNKLKWCNEKQQKMDKFDCCVIFNVELLSLRKPATKGAAIGRLG